MNTVSAAGYLPIPALSRRGVKQARIPYQRHRDDAAIPQTHAERVVRELHVEHALIRRRCRKTHSIPSEILPCALSQLIVSCAARWRETQNYAPVVLVPART